MACSWGFLVLLAATVVNAWEEDGHQITADIARHLVSSDTLLHVRNILGHGSDMKNVATWADDIKTDPKWKWTSDLHFINTPLWEGTYVPSRDCKDDNCVAPALFNYTQRSRDWKSSALSRREALKFLIHFHGDIHQPLHCGFGCDDGGNDIKGNTFLGAKDIVGQECNLHVVWDVGLLNARMVRSFNSSQEEYTFHLLKQIREGRFEKAAATWSACASIDDVHCFTEWGNEAAAMAVKFAYRDENGKVVPQGFDLGLDYFNFAAPIVDEQLAKGGVRLAATLDRAFGEARKWPSAHLLDKLVRA